jgi:hypothetical protein
MLVVFLVTPAPLRCDRMERTAWTDERLDHLAKRMDAGFGRLDQDIRELRTELRSEIRELRITLIRVGGAMMAGLVGVIAAVLAGG